MPCRNKLSEQRHHLKMPTYEMERVTVGESFSATLISSAGTNAVRQRVLYEAYSSLNSSLMKVDTFRVPTRSLGGVCHDTYPDHEVSELDPVK